MLIISITLKLLSNAVTLRRDKSLLYSRTAINVLLYCVYSNYFMKKSIKAIGLFGGLFHTTSITKIFHIFFYIICIIILQLNAYYPRKILKKSLNIYKENVILPNLSFTKGTGMLVTQSKKINLNSYKSLIVNKMGEQFKILEYSLIILFIISGAIFLMSSTDLISMFLSIELQSYGLYILCTIYKNSESSTKGGLTYFLLGGLSSCFILLGSCLLYSITGTTNLDGIYVITNLSEFSGIENLTSMYEVNYINISLIIMTVGFLFKVSAAPFHFWSPDVYDAIPTVVTVFVAIVAKISIFIFLLELLHYTGRNFFTVSEGEGFTWVNGLLVSSLLSLIIGTLLGLTQNRIKRLFAYSTISHIGFILLGLSIDSVESIQAFLFYLMQYSFSNLNAFFILISIGYIYYLTGISKSNELLDQNNSPIQFTKQIKGLFYVNPILALSLTITIFSFVGIPPLIGFFGKQMILSAALDSGYYFITIVAILTSVISAVYYLNIIKEIFFYPYALLSFTKGTEEKARKQNVVLSSYLTITISLLTLGILLFMFVPKELLSMANILALNLNNT